MKDSFSTPSAMKGPFITPDMDGRRRMRNFAATSLLRKTLARYFPKSAGKP